MRRLIMTITISLVLRRVASFNTAATLIAFAPRWKTQFHLTSAVAGVSILSGRSRPQLLRSRHFSTASLASTRDSNLERVRPFQVTSSYEPTGDQPLAIQQLVKQVQQGDKFSILQGITGTGKTFVMSHVIAHCNRPTLVLCHNKTLAAQLARELRSFFQHNSVELFVSYYNSYTPEYFIETTGTYSEKKCSVNDEIDALRHRATRALLERKDVIVVASVSCIFGLGLPAEYLEASTAIAVDDEVDPQDLVRQLKAMLYVRPEGCDDMLRGTYQLSRGNMFEGSSKLILSLWPPHEKYPMRIELETDNNSVTRIKSILSTNASGGLAPRDSLHIFPAKHHVVSDQRLEQACILIEQEMKDRMEELNQMGKHIESSRLQQRVMNDLLLLRETGYCPGAENYSRHLAGRAQGEPPDTLIDYFKLAGDGDWLLVVDESHVTLPQLKAMYFGDRNRKLRLVKHGYRLPSALDNRPLKDEEFWNEVSQAVFVSATPSSKELALAESSPVEMMIRPTFVCDPTIELRSPDGQLDHLVLEVKMRALRGERTLAMALTKRDAEDLSLYMLEHDVNSAYIHCDLTTQERSDALKALQNGDIDCLVGVNLLREGLDLPQVSLVAILNADSQGFLRSETALLQTVGRAARNMNGKAIFYAKRVTDAMQRCMDATNRRRTVQLAYNKEFNQSSISTKGSSMMSLFDLLKEEIESEKAVEIFRPTSKRELAGGVPRELHLAEFPSGSVSLDSRSSVITDHLPSKPGVYFWKDAAGNILYIGKAKKLRSRVKSYLGLGTKHSPRINIMLAKATTVEYVLTPSERDALVLESNLIKHHLPPYNVLLKDDSSYPYICASVGDAYPRFSAVPRRQVGEKASKYRYFGPYPKYEDINTVLDHIEEIYDLRAKSFDARYGSGTQNEYKLLFDRVLSEVFDGANGGQSMIPLRAEFEEASLLFGSTYNKCRDVVAIGQTKEGASDAVVHVLQLRNGLLANRFSYICTLPKDCQGTEDLASVIESVLIQRHYPSGEGSTIGGFSFFPDEVLLQYPLISTAELKRAIKSARTLAEPNRSVPTDVRHVASKGPRQQSDERAIEFAYANAKQVAIDSMLEGDRGATKTSLDGTAIKELEYLLSLENPPTRIECYDISHTQGEVAVGSRVVFVNGKPEPTLYRRFNIQSEVGNDDYASLEEVLQRRFSRVWVNGKGGLVGEDDPWAMPDLVVIDGGVGQLRAAIKGMAKSNVFPHFTDVDNGEGGDVIFEDDDMDLDSGASNGVESQLQRRAFVPICSLAKNLEEVFVYGRPDPVNDTPDSPGLLLLRSLRDESHRFALASHRRRRTAELVK